MLSVENLKAFFVIFFIFDHQNPGTGLDPDRYRIQPKMPDLDPYQMKMDPQPWLQLKSYLAQVFV